MHAGADQWQLRDTKLLPPVNTAPTHQPTQHKESPLTQLRAPQCSATGQGWCSCTNSILICTEISLSDVAKLMQAKQVQIDIQYIKRLVDT